MAKQNLTVFQKLGQVLSPDWVKLKGKQPQQPQRYNIGKGELLKTDNKAEYETAKLQAQQSKYLSSNWRKVENGLFQQSINYETTRIGSYADFESMEFYPMISAALDIFMEEATTLNDKGKMLNVYSDSKRVKGILEDLFYNRLDIHTSLPMFTRNLCKYGDDFVLLNIDEKHGIIGAKQMPNYEMERREAGLFDMISGRETVMSQEESSYTDKTKFFWRGRDIEFNSWQIAHFRLLGDDRRMPYGCSLLEKARRTWKQLLLSEDSMLVYRVTRAPERRVFKIPIGNIDPNDVEAHVNDVANKFKRTQIIDPQTGQVDLRLNMLSNDQDFFIPVRTEDAPNPIDTLPGACIALDTRIPLLDGRTLELQEIINEWDNGNRDLWVYSCNPLTGKLAPGMITWAGETRKNADVLKITLDNGSEIITTPDHKWVHRTNGFVEAKDLNVGDSLMPFYSDTKKIRSNTNDYHRVWDSSKQEWVFTHRMVVNELDASGLINEFVHNEKFSNLEKRVIHHKDYNRFNNNPNNLVWMHPVDHIEHHQDVIKYTIWKDPELNKEKISVGLKRYINNLSDEERIKRNDKLIKPGKTPEAKQKMVDTFNKNPNRAEIVKQRGASGSKTKQSEEFKIKFGDMSSKLWESEEYRNKVFSKPQKIVFTEKLYNMFVTEFLNHNRADFTLLELNQNINFINEFKDNNTNIRSSITNLDKFTVNHLNKMLRERGFKNFREWKKNILENYNHKITKIEFLKEKQNTGTITVDGNEFYHNYHTFALEGGVFIKNSNLNDIADIEYLRDNLFTALRVPKAFLGFEEATGEGKNLALQDIRFARTINRIQQSMLQELNKIAMIHLYLLGFEDDLDNFTLTMNNPSTQAEMLKIEHLQQKISLVKDATTDAGNGIAPMSWTRAHREILGWSDDEIKQDLLEQRMERAASIELTKTSSVIKHTGMFDVVDRIYGDYKLALQGGSEEGEGGNESGDSESSGGGGGLGGSFGGGGAGGEDLDFGDENDNSESSESDNTEGNESTPESGNSETENLSERLNKVKEILTEKKSSLTTELNNKKNKYQKKYLDLLVDSVKTDKLDESVIKTKIYDKNLKINNDINNMFADIKRILKE